MESFTLDKGPRDLTRIVGFLSALSQTVAWELTVKRKVKPRSDPQNNALWGVAYAKLSEFTGYDSQELHDVFMRAYFGEVEVEVAGMRSTKPRRTTTTNENGDREVMPVEDFSQLYAFIQRKAAEIGCYVPDPDPAYRLYRQECAA